MRHILMAAFTAGTLALSMGAAQAFPIAPVENTVTAPEVTLVSGGCGPFAHRGFYGRCRPNGYGPRFYGAPRFYGGPRFYGRPRFYGGYGYGPRRFHPHYY